MNKLHEKLNVQNYDNREEILRVCEEARRISNQIAKVIYRNRNKYKREEFKKWEKEIEIEGWRGSKRFFSTIMRKSQKRHSIRHIPKKYLKERQIDTNPIEIKKMIQEFWENLYSSNQEVRKEKRPDETKEWFNS
jgi:hypothetical protein